MKYFEKYPFIMIVIGVIGISLSSIFIRYSPAPSAVTAAWRLIWTVLFLAPLIFGNKQMRTELFQAKKKTLLLSAISGLFLAMHFALWFESLQHTTVASSTTIVCTEVIWVSLGYWLFMNGKIHPRALPAIMIALIGSGMIAFSDSGAGSHLYGDFLALFAAITVAAYMLIGRAVRNVLSTSVYTFVVYVACGLCLCLLSWTQGENLIAYGFKPILIGLLLAVFSTILGHSIFSWCLKFFSPSFVSASKLCEPVVAALLAGILFQEIPTFLQIVGGIFILGSVLYYSYIEGKTNR